MATATLRQTAKLSSLDAARAIFFIIAGLAVRSSLLFFLDTNNKLPSYAKVTLVFGFLFTLFRFSHGIAVVYELEKKTTETTTTPSSKRVEQVFALFALEAIFLFLMAERLAHPQALVAWTIFLLVADLFYICVSKTLKDANISKLFLPWYWRARWQLTSEGTAPRTHLQWAISDVLLVAALLLTLLPRPAITLSFTTGSVAGDWSFFIAILWIGAGVADYKMNSPFYFGGIRYRRRKCVFVCSPLKPAADVPIEEKQRAMYENIRRALWYCRELFLDRRLIPFASHGFYPYFLDDTEILDRKLGRKCALEFLAHCDALYIYTSNGRPSDTLSQGMQEELKYAKEHGLRIRYFKARTPGDEFQPAWAPLVHEPASEEDMFDMQRPAEPDLEGSFKKVFVCSPLRPRGQHNPVDGAKAIAENIRLAQWLCYQLIRKSESGRMLAVCAPHAFYPYFTDFDENVGLDWLESALDILKICDAIYVYTPDGLENDHFISAGMRECIDQARDLGLEVKFRRIIQPPHDWNPAVWKPAIVRNRSVGVSAP